MGRQAGRGNVIPAAEERRLLKVGALMDDDELRRLASLASEVPEEQAIVEVGSWAGGSAAWLSTGARLGLGARLTCVDPWEDWIDPPEGQEIVTGDAALANLQEITDPAYVTALRAPSLTVAPMWTKPIGLLFIDGLHTYEACRDDLAAWTPYVVPGGVVVTHDYMTDPTPERLERYWWTEGPTRAVDEFFFANEAWTPLGVVDWSWAARRR